MVARACGYEVKNFFEEKHVEKFIRSNVHEISVMDDLKLIENSSWPRD